MGRLSSQLTYLSGLAGKQSGEFARAAASAYGTEGQALSPFGLAIGSDVLGGPGPFQQQQLDLDSRQFDAEQANRQQLLELLGFTSDTLGEGGLLGQPFFGSILGNQVGDVVGSVTGNIPGVGGGGAPMIGQPGGPEIPGQAPGNVSSGGGGAGGLFGSLLEARGDFGSAIMGLLENFGGSERERIRQDFQNAENTATARLEARGLGGSTLVDAAQRGIEESEQEALGGLEDRLIAQRVGALSNIGEGLFGSLEQELGRQVQRQEIGTNLLGSLLGSAFRVF